MGPTIRLIKLFGIPIEINFSWIFVFLLIIYLLGDHFGGAYPWWPAAHRWALAVSIALLFFLSVLAHELCHSLLAVKNGIPVERITLFLFGGVSQLCHEARRPLTEFSIAIVGPLSSIALALALFGLWVALRDMSATLEITLRLLVGVNLMLGLFNLLPGFPLDGGRVLRAAAWGATGNYWLAARIAARMGQGTGALMAVGGLVLAALEFRQFGVAGIWFALIGTFLLVAATTSYRQERNRKGLMRYKVADIMADRWGSRQPGVLPGTPLIAQGESLHAVTGSTRRSGGSGSGGSGSGGSDGRWARRILDRMPRTPLAAAPISEATQSGAGEFWVTPDDTVMEAMEQVRAGRQDRLPVVRDGELLGFLAREDIQSFARRVLRRESRLRRP